MKTQKLDAGVKTCWLRETKKKKLPNCFFLCCCSRNGRFLLPPQTQLLPSTSCVSLYSSSWLSLTLYGFFQSTGCLLHYLFTYGQLYLILFTIFKQKALGLKVVPGLNHTTPRNRFFQEITYSLCSMWSNILQQDPTLTETPWWNRYYGSCQK